ncbi:IS4/Tn5 family transposase DNA-binding protein [Azospirillum doebereinerae]|uniref:IS4/Tn5 family transposase DNA-binding protein n=1 Tax=Azospirillum doebereinerae TaxID=92933 RepID=UPI001B3BD4A8|nr:transposase [Azospirillum doebereinerae]
MTIGLLILNDVWEVPMVTGTNAWIEDELAGCRLADERLERRLSTLLDQMAGAMGDSIPLACQDWANTKAAYRFSPTTG